MAKDYLKVLNISLKEKDRADIFFKALSNRKRRDILSLLDKKGPLSIVSIAFYLDLPISTVSEDVSMLLKTGLISVIKKDSVRGQSKIVSRQYEQVNINLVDDNVALSNENEVIETPIGAYQSFHVNKLCGMLSENGYIGPRDDTNCFYESNRFEAQLIWFDYGYLEYKIPFKTNKTDLIDSLSFTLELCSETPKYNEKWPSDIFFEVNNQDMGYFISPGDFGERRGRYTPNWWNDATSYGILKNLTINSEGCFIDGVKTSDVTIEDLHLGDSKVITFRVGVKEDAKNRGGMNIFGNKFGDYPQHIVLIISHK